MRERWSQDEDSVIRAHAVTYGGGQQAWDVLAAHLPGRSTDSIRNRWHRLGLHKQDVETLKDALCDPKLLHAQLNGLACAMPAAAAKVVQTRQYWTRDEDNIILSAVERLGMSWRKIAKALPPQENGKLRTDSSVRNRWKRLCEGSGGTMAPPSTPPAPAAAAADPPAFRFNLPPLAAEPAVRERAASMPSTAHEPTVRERAASMPMPPPTTAKVDDFPRPSALFLRQDSFGLRFSELSERSVERNYRDRSDRWGGDSDEEDEGLNSEESEIERTRRVRFDAVLHALEECEASPTVALISPNGQLPSPIKGCAEGEIQMSLTNLSELLAERPEWSSLKISADEIESATSSMASSASLSEREDEGVELEGAGGDLGLLDDLAFELGSSRALIPQEVY